MRSKWVFVAWIVGIAGLAGGAGATIHSTLFKPPGGVAAQKNPRGKRGTEHTGTISPNTPSPTAAVPSISASSSSAVAPSSPNPTPQLAPFQGQDLAIETPAVTASVLPRNYPLASNPVEYYTPGQFTMIQALSATLNGSPVQVQIFAGAAAPLLTLAIAHDGTPIATHVFSHPISVVALTGQSLVVESLPSNQAPEWYTVNLQSGATTNDSTSPTGWSPENPDVQGIASGTLRTTLNPHSNAAPPSPAIDGSTLTDVLVKEVNAMLLTALTPGNAMVERPSPNQAVLTALVPTHWKTIDFQHENGTWVPTRIHTTADNLALTYDVSSTSVVMPYAEMQTVQREMALGSYSMLDTQIGALARLPINLEGAFSNGPINLPKINVVDQGRSILALTYTVSNNGQTVFVPIGWYWWTNPPSFLSPTPPPSSASPSRSPSPPPSSSPPWSASSGPSSQPS